MTVEWVDTTRRNAKCVWYLNGALKNVIVKLDALKVVAAGSSES